jgi:hypothetical protein
VVAVDPGAPLERQGASAVHTVVDQDQQALTIPVMAPSEQ